MNKVKIIITFKIFWKLCFPGVNEREKRRRIGYGIVKFSLITSSYFHDVSFCYLSLYSIWKDYTNKSAKKKKENKTWVISSYIINMNSTVISENIALIPWHWFMLGFTGLSKNLWQRERLECDNKAVSRFPSWLVIIDFYRLKILKKHVLFGHIKKFLFTFFLDAGVKGRLWFSKLFNTEQRRPDFVSETNYLLQSFLKIVDINHHLTYWLCTHYLRL